MDIEIVEDKYKFNPEKWVHPEKWEHPEKWVHPEKKNKLFKKYILTTTFFVIGLILVSSIKNETRKLQKEIADLKSSLVSIKITLHEATLDHYYLTSPDNIDKLAKKYLETDFTFYKNSQISDLIEKKKDSNKIFSNKKKVFERKSKEFSQTAKTLLAKKIEEKKEEIKKLQELYEKPEKIPERIKFEVAQKIEIKKNELKNLYHEPESIINSDRVVRWSIVQLVKAFLGMPIIPGR